LKNRREDWRTWGQASSAFEGPLLKLGHLGPNPQKTGSGAELLNVSTFSSLIVNVSSNIAHILSFMPGLGDLDRTLSAFEGAPLSVRVLCPRAARSIKGRARFTSTDLPLSCDVHDHRTQCRDNNVAQHKDDLECASLDRKHAAPQWCTVEPQLFSGQARRRRHVWPSHCDVSDDLTALTFKRSLYLQ